MQQLGNGLFEAIPCSVLKAREKSHVHVAIGFGFPSHWLINWREIFEAINKPSNRNREITFDSHHLKTALTNILELEAWTQWIVYIMH